jgi:RNA polymerase sigma factor (sigma-70 family)
MYTYFATLPLIWSLSTHAFYLTNHQVNILFKYITHTRYNPSKSSSKNNILVSEVKNILFERYVGVAYKITKDFRAFHTFKCRHIPKEDLEQGALLGLWLCLDKYNTTYPFYPYAKRYIVGSLYKTLTAHYPISKDSKAERIKRKPRMVCSFDKTGLLHQKNYQPFFVESPENIHTYQRDFYPYWDVLDTLDTKSVNMFFCKFNRYFVPIRSNLEVAKVMGCSQETVRKTVNQILRVLEKESGMVQKVL